jgi:hypothetical protein
MNDISIRLAREVDLDEIEKIYAKAREFMRATGNPTQWGNSYPERELLEQDVKNCWLYLVQKEGKSVDVFVTGSKDCASVLLREPGWHSIKEIARKATSFFDLSKDSVSDVINKVIDED